MPIHGLLTILPCTTISLKNEENLMLMLLSVLAGLLNDK